MKFASNSLVMCGDAYNQSMEVMTLRIPEKGEWAQPDDLFNAEMRIDVVCMRMMATTSMEKEKKMFSRSIPKLV